MMASAMSDVQKQTHGAVHPLTASAQRLQSVTYPADKVIYYDYGADGAIDDRLQRVSDPASAEPNPAGPHVHR